MIFITGCSEISNSQNSSNGLSDSRVSGYPSARGQEKYDALIQELTDLKVIREDFLHVNNLSCLGDFVTFTPTTKFPDYYEYTFRDMKGDNNIYVSIAHSDRCKIPPSRLDFTLRTVTADMTSMHTYPLSTDLILIEQNGIEYYYAGGRMSKLIFTIDEIEFKIHTDLRDYDAPEDGFDLNKLCSIDEAEVKAALEEFKQFLNAK